MDLPELPPLPTDILELVSEIEATLRIKLAHEAAMAQTAAGQRSVDLRMEAQDALQRLPVEQTHQMFLAAANLHPVADSSRAAAAARFDLARSFERQQAGSEVENHLHAEQLYRIVVACPERDEEALRAALSRDALAVCLRHLAQFPTQAQRRPELLAEAVQLSLAAIARALSAGPLGLLPAAFYLNSLANHLRHKKDRFEDSLACLHLTEICIERAFAVEKQLATALRSSIGQLLSNNQRMTIGGYLAELEQERGTQGVYGVLYNVSAAYLQRGREEDLKCAEKILVKLLKDQPSLHIDAARIALAQIYLNRGKHDEGKKLLRLISWERLRAEQAEDAVEVFAKAGLVDEALGLAHHFIAKYHEMRTESLADHIASELASRSHRLGALAARIYAKQNDFVAAFLALETTSGAYFEEQVGQHVRPQARHPIARGLLEMGNIFKEASLFTDEFASRFEHVRAVDPDGAIAGVRHMLERYQNLKLPFEHKHYPNEVVDRYTKKIFTDSLTKALASSNPVESLRADSLDFLARLIQFGNKAELLDRNLTLKQPFPNLGTKELANLLKRQSDTCFIRFSLETDLLVVSVWHEKGRICGRTLRLALPQRLYALLDAIQNNPQGGDPAVLRRELERIDLAKAFPPTKRAVLLPSWLASRLPLAALGPFGKTLLDRYTSLLWMPCLAPLRRRQHAQPPRTGMLTVAPRCVDGLKLQRWALNEAFPNERRLFDAEATLSNVKEAARSADVAVFYSHGRHEPGSIEVELADQPLKAAEGARFGGAERVELWACQTGVNRATDWLVGADHDEDFGLDTKFVEAGARSAIGSLWAVPELVTACLVRRYRTALRAGEDAAAALCTAQRSFRDDLLPQILRVADGGGDAVLQAMNRFFAKLASGDGTGNSLTTDSLDAAQSAHLKACLASPTAWAGFRFVGVPEQRPTEPWDPEIIRPLTEFELIELDTVTKELLAEPPPSRQAQDAESAAAQTDADDSHWLAQETLLRELWSTSEPLTPERALRAARLYHDRLHSSRQHNLLTGLAWLYEVLAAKNLDPKSRLVLRLEASHLWLELADSEVDSPGAVALSCRHGKALARAEQLLTADAQLNSNLLGKDAPRYQRSQAAAGARLTFLRSLGQHRAPGLDLQGAVPGAVRSARPLLDTVLFGPIEHEYTDRRALSIACCILALDTTNHRKALKQLKAQISKALPNSAVAIDWVSVQRLVAWQRALLSTLEPRRALPIMTHWDIHPRERLHTARAELQQLAEHGAVAVDSQKVVLSQHLGSMEQALWGAPEDRLRAFLLSTGTLGEGYRSLFGAFLCHPEDGPAVHRIACMQQACDLRTPVLQRLVQATPAVAKTLSVNLQPLWEQILIRERLAQALVDTVKGFPVDVPAGSPTEPPSEPRMDPFVHSAEELQAAIGSSPEHVAWVLSSLATVRPSPVAAHTAAFRAAAQCAGLSAQIEHRWQEALAHSDQRVQSLPAELKAHADLASLIDPGVRITDCEHWLRTLPEGHAVLGWTFSSSLEIAGSFTWRTRSRQGEQSGRHEHAFETRALLFELFRELADTTERRGYAGKRPELWERLAAQLAPFLHRLCGPALAAGEQLHLHVLAPGSLRLLPLTGLRVGEQPLRSVFRSITHLPALQFDEPMPLAPAGRQTGCLFAASAATEGMLEFGRAAISTLRRAFPAVMLEPRHPDEFRGQDVVEIDQIQAIASELRCLRIYGQGSVISGTASDAALLMSKKRVLCGRNLMDTLPACDVVELWAATAGMASAVSALCDREDQLPGLVPFFLQCGAHGVIDLAWPVFDLVKALVCERYGLVNQRLPSSTAEALAQAVAWAEHTLADWRAARSEYIGVRGALAWLDSARSAAVIALGGDPHWVEPFVTLAEHPIVASLSTDELIKESTQPCHLAAFRYWGGRERKLSSEENR